MQMIGNGLFSPEAARAALRNKTMYFAGDSTTRRLMYAFCAFLGEQNFYDRYGPMHGHLQCPEGPSDDLVKDAHISLHFVWAPKVHDLDQLEHFADADAIITSIYHHDRLSSKDPRLHDSQWGQHAVQWGQSTTSANPNVRVVLVGPNLLTGSTQNMIQENQNIMDVFSNMETAVSRSQETRVVTVDNTWMQTESRSAVRHPCLGDVGGPGIHLRYQFGNFLQMQYVLPALVKA